MREKSPHALCRCGHQRGDHRPFGECLLDDCDCLLFTDVDGGPAARARKRGMSAIERAVVERIAREHGVTPAALLGRSRHPTVVAARDHALAVFRWSTEYSFPELGRLFGRDHTTVISAVARYEERLNRP